MKEYYDSSLGKVELNQCSKCGGEPYLVTEDNTLDWEGVMCKNIQCDNVIYMLPEAIELWNSQSSG